MRGEGGAHVGGECVTAAAKTPKKAESNCHCIVRRRICKRQSWAGTAYAVRTATVGGRSVRGAASPSRRDHCAPAPVSTATAPTPLSPLRPFPFPGAFPDEAEELCVSWALAAGVGATLR